MGWPHGEDGGDVTWEIAPLLEQSMGLALSQPTTHN